VRRWPGSSLSTVGVVVTAGVTALGAWWLLDIDLLTAAILGAVVGSTDAAAIFSLMRTSELPQRTGTLLRVESGLNDPLAATLTIGLVATAVGTVGLGDWVRFALLQPGAGVLIGVGVGWLGARALVRLRLAVEGFYPLAVFLTGVVLGARVPRYRRVILDFHEATATAAEIGLFLLLGLLVFPSRLPAVALSAVLVALVLTFVARPVAVWLCTLGQGFDWRERTAVSVGGLKGAVPIVLATFPLTAGIPGAAVVFDTVFFVTLVSLTVQAAAVVPVIRRLGLATSRSPGAALAEALPLRDLDLDLVELEVTAEMAIAGRPLREHRASDGMVVTAIVRGDRVLVPSGATVPKAGDVLLIATQRIEDALACCTEWAHGGGDRATDATTDPRGG
jgi:potassium/hydrogen antiporter